MGMLAKIAYVAEDGNFYKTSLEKGVTLSSRCLQRRDTAAATQLKTFTKYINEFIQFGILKMSSV